MLWYDKRYHTLDYELKETFGQKIIKLSLDGGFTCPTRDGSLGVGGCIFCGEQGAGEFAGAAHLPILNQIKSQKELLKRKWPQGKYLAYFQNFTNTYGPVEKLDRFYSEALQGEDVVGLAIATRPDCLSEEVLDLLEKYAKKTYLWVELGIQTIHPRSSKFIRRGYDLDCFLDAVQALSERNIPIVVHLIFGLPDESKENMLESVRYIAGLEVWGVKIHLLHILKGTDLRHVYQKDPFPILEQAEYISLVCDALELLPPEMVIHRLTGDGKKDLLVAPLWSLDKLRVLSGIDQELRLRDSWQGKHYGRI